MAERMGTSIVSGGESEVENYSLYPPGSKVPHDICERIITKSPTVSQKLLKNVHLDAETLSSLVSRDVITPENSTLMRNEAFAPSSRIFDILRPALLKGGARSLEAFYRTLVVTSEGRMGHAELAADIKKRVDYHLRKEAENSSPLGRSGTPRSGSRLTVDHVPDADSTEDDVHYKLRHSQQLYVKQSSLPVDVEHDNDKKTSLVQRHLSDDGTYKGKPRSQPKVANTQDADSDSSLCSTDRDGSGRSKQKPSAASLMKALETEYVEKFKEDHGAVRVGFIEELTVNRHLRSTGAPLLLAEWLLSVEDAKKVDGCASPQISDIVDLWIGKRLKCSGLFGMATCLARVPGLGRYITCIVQQTGACTAAELAHFTKALGHSWVIFAQKIGYKEDELKVKGSSKISKKAFFASIWQVPKFDKDQLKGLFCELLTVTEQQDVLRNFRNRLSKAATGHGLDALPHSESSTITMSSLTSAQRPVHPQARSRAERSGDVSESSITTTTTDTETETDTDWLQEEGSTAGAQQARMSINADVDSPRPSESHSLHRKTASGISSCASGTEDSLVASSLPPPCDDSEYSSATLVDGREWSSSDESGFALELPDEEDHCDESALMVYDRSAIFFGPDIVPPLISKRSEFAGLYKLLKDQPFDQELFEVVLVSETSLVNRLTKDDRSLLFLACELNNSEAVTVLLKHGANPNLQDKYGRTCLHLLSVYWNETILWALLQNESTNVNVATFKTQTTPLSVACLMKEVAAVKKLLEKGADPNGAEETSWPPIVIAAREGAHQVVEELLDKGAVVDSQNTEGYTALHMAAFADHHQIVELLLAHKSNPNLPATNCATALSCAAANGHIDTTRLLVENSATVNTTRRITHDGALAGSEVSALAEAALGGHTDVVVLLLDAGADLNFKSESYLSVLAYACIGGSADVVRHLMIHGDIKPSELALPLQSALQYENYRCAKVLVEEAGGVEALKRAHRYDTQFLQDLNAVSALLSSGGEEMLNLGDGVPKSVGRTDDEFQRYRSRSIYATIEEVKLAELFTPDEAMFYEGLVQYIIEKHIVLTAELMVGEEVLMASAEGSGYNEVADFMRQYKSNMIQPAELSLRLNCTSPPVIGFYCKHVDLVRLQQYARSTDNRIALQYFLEMQRRRDMGHVTGFGLQMSHYGTPFQSGFTSQNIAELQSGGFQLGHGLGNHGMTLGSGLQGGRSLGMGLSSPFLQGMSAPRSSPAARAKPKDRAVSPPKMKDGSTGSATLTQKGPTLAGASTPMTLKKSLHAGGSDKVSSEPAAPVNTAPSHPQSAATQSSRNDSEETVMQTCSEDELTVAESRDRLGTPSSEPRRLNRKQSATVSDLTGRKNRKQRSHLQGDGSITSEDDVNKEKRHRRDRKKKESIDDSYSTAPESVDEESSNESETQSVVSTLSTSTGSTGTATSDSVPGKTRLLLLKSDGMAVQSLEPQLADRMQSHDSGIVSDSTEPKHRKPRNNAHVRDSLSSKDDAYAKEKQHRKDQGNKDDNDRDIAPDSSHDDGSSWSESQSLVSTPSTSTDGGSTSTGTSLSLPVENMQLADAQSDGVVAQSPEALLPNVGKSLSSIQSGSGVGQSHTPKLPTVSPLVNQAFRADPQSSRTLPTPTVSSEDEVPVTVRVHSPPTPNIVSKENTEDFGVFLEERAPLPVPDPLKNLEVQPSSDGQASLPPNFELQHNEHVEEAEKADVNDGKSTETARIPDDMPRSEGAKSTEPGSVASGSEIPPNIRQTKAVAHKSGQLLCLSATACLRLELGSPDCNACMLVKSIPDELIDRNCSKDELLLRKVCPLIKQRWSTLARYLGLQEVAVSEIKEKCDTSEGRGMEVVLTWIKQSRDCSGSPTWQQLAICLAFVLRIDLVHLIRSRLVATQPLQREALLGSEIISTNSSRHLCILTHVAESLAENWEHLAKQLRVNQDSVGCCDAYNNSTSLCYAVLMLWLSERKGKDGLTFEMLFAHLRNMDCDHIVGEALLIASAP